MGVIPLTGSKTQRQPYISQLGHGWIPEHFIFLLLQFEHALDDLSFLILPLDVCTISLLIFKDKLKANE